MAKKKGIELRVVIDQLREELLALTETVSGEELRFALESVDVELKVGVTKEVEGGAKAKFWVLELGAEGKYGTERTQTIKLKLSPRLKSAKEGTETLIGRRPATGEQTGDPPAAQKGEETLIRRE